MNGKYALFIWGSYALTAAVLLWNILLPRIARRDVIRRLADPEQANGRLEGIDE